MVKGSERAALGAPFSHIVDFRGLGMFSPDKGYCVR